MRVTVLSLRGRGESLPEAGSHIIGIIGKRKPKHMNGAGRGKAGESMEVERLWVW